jgi:hypothetical protein
MSKVTKEQIKEWKQPPQGFFKWLEHIQPRVISPYGKLIYFEAADFQKEMFEGALSVDEDNNYKYSTIIYSLPRRHSKTTCAALLVLYRFCLFPNENIKVISNSEAQALRVNFKTLKDLIVHCDFLAQWVGVDNIQRTQIALPDLGNRIEVVVGNIPSLYGERITCGWFSELHAAGDDEALQILSSSQGDVKNAMTIIDSTTDPENGPLHQLEMVAQKDPTIFVYRREYKNLAEAKKLSPVWVQRPWLDSRHKQLLATTFASQHLNRRSESANKLFQPKDIKAAKQSYRNHLPLEAYKDMIAGRRYAVGLGLDRAKFGSLHGDKTYLTTVARSVNEEGEAIYHVLAQDNIRFSLDKTIKDNIIKFDAEYGITNIVMEDYNVQDLVLWANERGYACEAVYPHSKTQVPAFTNLSKLFEENRIFFPKELKTLEKELSSFYVEFSKKGHLTFGTRNKNDDTVYSLCWAVHALRAQDTVIYELNDIVCNSKSRHARHCFLRNGDMILNCANTCAAYKQVQAMYNQYMKATPESELTLQQFFKRLVKVSGIKTYNAL